MTGDNAWSQPRAGLHLAGNAGNEGRPCSKRAGHHQFRKASSQNIDTEQAAIHLGTEQAQEGGCSLYYFPRYLGTYLLVTALLKLHSARSHPTAGVASPPLSSHPVPTYQSGEPNKPFFPHPLSFPTPVLLFSLSSNCFDWRARAVHERRFLYPFPPTFNSTSSAPTLRFMFGMLLWLPPTAARRPSSPLIAPP